MDELKLSHDRLADLDIRCPRCGYSLRGHTGEWRTCPECGTRAHLSTSYSEMARTLEARLQRVIADFTILAILALAAVISGVCFDPCLAAIFTLGGLVYACCRRAAESRLQRRSGLFARVVWYRVLRNVLTVVVVVGSSAGLLALGRYLPLALQHHFISFAFLAPLIVVVIVGRRWYQNDDRVLRGACQLLALDELARQRSED